MPTARIFIDDISPDVLELDKNTAHHLKNVLRMRSAEPVIIFDGQGNKFSATVSFSGKNASIVKQEKLTPSPKPAIKLHLAQAITRKERMDFCIQKAVECGVNAITPIFTAQSEVRLAPERLKKKMQHWQELIIYACEQCGQDWLPTLHPALQLSKFIESNKPGLVCLPNAGLRVNQLEKSDNYTILIGPEAGFSSNEIYTLEQNNWQAITLGPLVLRTETAGIVALTQLQMLI